MAGRYRCIEPIQDADGRHEPGSIIALDDPAQLLALGHVEPVQDAIAALGDLIENAEGGQGGAAEEQAQDAPPYSPDPAPPAAEAPPVDASPEASPAAGAPVAGRHKPRGRK